MSKLLLDEYPLIVLPKLATIIGLNEAIFIQQLHYWLCKSKNTVKGLKWSFNSYADLQEQFPFFSLKTIQRTVKNLKNKELILVENLSADKRDKTNWYTINYDNFNKLMDDIKGDNASSQDDLMYEDKMASSIETNCPDDIVLSLTETTTETTTENIKKETKKVSYVLPDSVDTKLFSDYLELRKTLKAPNTQRAINGLINKLNSFEAKGFNTNDIIATAYENGWKSFYEPRPQFNRPTNNTNVDFALQHNVFDIIENIPEAQNNQEVLNG